MASQVTQLVFDDPAALAEGAADWIAETLTAAVDEGGVANLVLAGGSTPAATYRALAERAVDWGRVRFFWGDERCVPPGDPASNYRMARWTLLEPASVPSDSVFRIEGERPPAEAAARYERALRDCFTGSLPRFDLVLLGVGTDGHVASLFPGSIEESSDRWVRAVTGPGGGPARVTLGLAALAAAGRLCFIVGGASKAPIVGRLLSGEAPELPAARLVTRAKGVTWLLDRAAAATVV